MDLRASRSNSSLYFLTGCFLKEASAGEVSFQLDESLKKGFKDASQSKDITISELLKINPKMNKNKFNISARITTDDVCVQRASLFSCDQTATI